MKAVICTQYGPPEVLKLIEVEKPVPGPDEILIKVHAASVTASDCIVRSGRVPIALWLPMRLVVGLARPRNILGMVLAGEIESTGRDVKQFHVRDKVFAFNIVSFGAYAEYSCMPENGVVAVKPANATFTESAAIPYGGMLALHFLRKVQIRSGQKVLIYGASGANGTAAVQLSKYFGAEVSGVCSTANLDLVRSLGADTVIDYTKEGFSFRDWKYDLIFDAVGRRKSSNVQFKNALAPGGKFISVDDGSPRLHAEDLVFLKGLVEAGKIKPVVDRTYPLEQIVAAHRYVDLGHKRGNVVITLDPNNHPESFPS